MNFTVVCNVIEVDCLRIYIYQSSCVEIEIARMMRNWIKKIKLRNTSVSFVTSVCICPV